MKIRSVNHFERIYNYIRKQLRYSFRRQSPYGDHCAPTLCGLEKAVRMIEPAIELTEQSDIFIFRDLSQCLSGCGLLNYVRRRLAVFLIDPMDV
jgi:hypothetical protein